jgi:NADH-quinone oxidoreductase subunit L
MLYKLILFLPLTGFLFSGILSRIIPQKKISDNFAKFITTSLIIISAIISFKTLIDVHNNKISENIVLLNWINSGNLNIDWAIKIDSLTAIMLFVVTSVSSLVHIYSLGYMHEDKSIARFMSYLSLFTFFMLSLVTANNFVQLFFGWEGVGLASYLLIGFWYKKQSANLAAMKAFIVNRVGDFGLIIAIALIYFTFGTVDFTSVFNLVQSNLNNKLTIFSTNFNIIDLISILLFIGAMGKSAQIFLHVWLADAMEGPTPVSALIHAATMVTAGVFLVARCSPIFECSLIGLNFIIIVGAMTALFSATIAITQNDIKKIIAYSTCSQLGYMFFACGVSAYSAGIFHLTTHAFFKALLFLSAGSVIHAMHHEQDIRNMGGLRKKIPFTYIMMWIGSLALAGFPPFAGFYSKDAILEVAFTSHNPLGKFAYYIGIISAFLTAFYSWRLLFLVFHGNNRGKKATFDHAHESPKSMLLPLLILAIGSITSGFIGANFLNIISTNNNFFENSIYLHPDNNLIYEEMHHAPLIVKLSPLLVGLLAIFLSYLFYVKKPALPNLFASKFRFLYNLSFNKWFFDEIYEKIFIKPTRILGNLLWKIVDVKIIDAIPNNLASFCKYMSNKTSRIQTGYIYNYSMWMVLGLVLILLLFTIYSFNFISK